MLFPSKKTDICINVSDVLDTDLSIKNLELNIYGLIYIPL